MVIITAFGKGTSFLGAQYKVFIKVEWLNKPLPYYH